MLTAAAFVAGLALGLVAGLCLAALLRAAADRPRGETFAHTLARHRSRSPRDR